MLVIIKLNVVGSCNKTTRAELELFEIFQNLNFFVCGAFEDFSDCSKISEIKSPDKNLLLKSKSANNFLNSEFFWHYWMNR